METSYELISYQRFETLVAENKLCLRNEKVCKDGAKSALYFGSPACVVINRTIYAFKDSTGAIKFFVYTEKAPLGTTNYEIPVSYKYATDIFDLQYQQVSFNFFKRRKLSWPSLKIISERNLHDGRKSVIYAKMADNRAETYLHYYLVIEDLVFTCYNDFGYLLNLEEAINNGSITKWRPELAGKMTYIPAYNVNVYTKRHEQYIKRSTLIATYILPGGIKALIYERIGKSTRYYMRVEDKIYMFTSLTDCETIIDQLKASSNLEAMIEMDTVKLKRNIKIVGARLNCYINSDMEYCSSPAFKVSEKGSLICLNPSL